MKVASFFKSIVSLLLVISLVAPSFVYAEVSLENNTKYKHMELLQEEVAVYNLEGNVVATITDGTLINVIEEKEGKVFFQWATEVAYVLSDEAKVVENELEELDLDIQSNPVEKFITTEKTDVYTGEEKTTTRLTFEPNVEYVAEKYSEELYKVLIGDHFGYIESTLITFLPQEGVNVEEPVLEDTQKEELPPIEIEEEAQSELMQTFAVQKAIGFTATDKYFEPLEKLGVFDNSTGELLLVGYIEKGQTSPRVGDYGDWHKIKYGNGFGFVWKASTKPGTASGIKNLNPGLENSDTSVKALSVLGVFDNTSGKLVHFASLNKGVPYPVISEEDEWYKIDIAGRIGYIYKQATVKEFNLNDKFFEATEKLAVYNNSKGTLEFVGYLNQGQSYERISDYGDWHKIKHGNSFGFVWKAGTRPSSSNGIKNLNPGLINSDITVMAESLLSVYDNTSGALVPFATINKGISYPIISEIDDWYKIDIAGRIGHIYKPATKKRDFWAVDKYFKTKERVPVYDNGGGTLKLVGYLDNNETFPRVSDFGEWHRIEFGNRYGYVWKESTEPTTGAVLRNENKSNFPVTNQRFIGIQDLPVYDNTSGGNVQYATILKGEEYPIISDLGPDWYEVDVAGRIGFVFKGGINKITQYNMSLQKMLDMQMKASPQTDKYRSEKSYVSAQYITLDAVDKTKGIVQTNNLNVRNLPNTWNSRVVGSLKQGVTVKIVNTVNDWYEISFGPWKNATSTDVLEHLNVNYLSNNSFQFLVLSQHANTNVNELNASVLLGKGILAGRGAAFINAAKQHNVNEVYLMAHAFLETGNGTSALAKGQLYNGKMVYNMFGIGAYDSCPNTCGAQKAFEQGWFTPEAAIIGGAKFISETYIYSKYNQDTIYKMRWNPEFAAKNGYATHQYATDIGWAAKQAVTIENIYKKLNSYTLKFDIPKYTN